MHSPTNVIVLDKRHHICSWLVADWVLEFIASHFADLVEARIEEGLHRAYVEVEENLPIVRGRIQVLDDIRQNYVLRHRVYCRFAELTWDVLENQILRYAVHLLSGWPFSVDLQARLHQLDRRMDEVSLVPISVEAIDGIQYTRLNAAYQPLHRLSRLFIEQMSLAEEEGPTEFTSFLIDMNVLFETFVASILQKYCPLDLEVTTQRYLYLGRRHIEERTLLSGRIVPDIQVGDGHQTLAVLDTKFKRSGPENINNPDFYQLLAYCTALGTWIGGLIYPRSELQRADELSVMNSQIRITRFVIDLRVPPDRVLSEGERLARDVWNWVAERRNDRVSGSLVSKSS